VAAVGAVLFGVATSSIAQSSGPFTKTGDNGTVSCTTYCGGSQWAGGVGTCTSAFSNDSGRAIDCNAVPGLSAAGLTCNCNAGTTFVKSGNNGTVSCSTYCGGSQWSGGVGACVSASRNDTHAAIDCGAVAGLSGAGVSCTCTATGAAQAPPPAAPTSSYLKTGDALAVHFGDGRAGDGGVLVSPSGNFYATVSYAGRFSIFKGPSPDQSYGVTWSVPVTKCCVSFVVQQGDGNFVSYFGSGPSDNEGYIWGTQRTGPGGQFFTALQDDGNLCTYRGTAPNPNQGAPIWCSYSQTPVTWASGQGLMIINVGTQQAITYTGNPMPAWGMAVSMQGVYPSSRWTFMADTTMRWSTNNACLEVDPTKGNTGLVACNGSPNQRGWYYQNSDQTIRKSSSPTGCIVPGPSPLYVNSSPVANLVTPCPGGPNSQWVRNLR
jgi:hypothetical protein